MEGEQPVRRGKGTAFLAKTGLFFEQEKTETLQGKVRQRRGTAHCCKPDLVKLGGENGATRGGQKPGSSKASLRKRRPPPKGRGGPRKNI